MNDVKVLAKDCEVTIESGGNRYVYKAYNVVLEEDVHDEVILSDYSMYPISRVVDRTYILKAHIDPYNHSRPVGNRTVVSPNRVYTIVDDLSVESITYAKNLVGAKDRDIFEIEEHENGYKLTWETEV